MNIPFLPLLFAAPALLAGEMQLLNGHLSITLPDGAIYGQRSTDLMGPGPGDDETLIWLGEGDDRVAIYAEEIGAFAADDFAAKQKEAMQRSLGKRGIGLDISERDNPVIVYALAREAPAQPSGSNVLAWADVRHADGTMQRLSFVFARNRVKDFEACRRLAKDAIESIRAGAPLPLQARDERIADIDEAGKGLVLPLPEGCHAVHAEGADFLFNTYTLIRPVGVPENSLRLYLGHYPGELDEPEETRKGTVLGEAVEWGITRYPEEGSASAECLVRVAPGLYTHLIVYGVDDKGLDETIAWAESLRIDAPRENTQP